MSAEGPPKLLEVITLTTGYGKKRVVADVSLDVGVGEIVTLIGHNGAGKSTLLKAIFGLLPIWNGSILLEGNRLQSLKPRDLLRLGVVYVPQGNRVFTELSVRENLEVTAVVLGDKNRTREGVDLALGLFPSLKPRLRQRAATLSGGEKQMLALAGAIALSPRLLLLDEPSLGLAPLMVTEILSHIQQIASRHRLAALIVEQKVREVLTIAQRVYVLRSGSVSFAGPAQALQDDVNLRRVYL